MNSTIQEYSQTIAALSELSARYSGVVYAVDTPVGMAEAKEGRRELRTLRTDLEKMRVAIKAPALERCRLIDSEAKEITTQLLALEEPIDAQIKKEENKAKELAMAKAIAERKAAEDAERAKREAEEAKMAAERAEIERIKAAQAEQQRILDERERAAKALIAEADAKAMEARIAAEEATRKARDEQGAADREKQRAALARMDAEEMLRLFSMRYGKLEEFRGVIDQINLYFSTVKVAA